MQAPLLNMMLMRELVALPCRDDIRQDPTFRAQFHVMCANVGVDPLASNKGMFAQLLGIGDFYYQLGVQIIEACLATRTHNGGMIELSLLRRLVQVGPGQHGSADRCSAPCASGAPRVGDASHAGLPERRAAQLPCPC